MDNQPRKKQLKTCIKQVAICLERENPIYGESVIMVTIQENPGCGGPFFNIDGNFQDDKGIDLTIPELEKALDVARAMEAEYNAIMGPV